MANHKFFIQLWNGKDFGFPKYQEMKESLPGLGFLGSLTAFCCPFMALPSVPHGDASVNHRQGPPVLFQQLPGDQMPGSVSRNQRSCASRDAWTMCRSFGSGFEEDWVAACPELLQII